MSQVTVPKEQRRWAKIARRRGWVITMAGDGHIKWESPERRIVTTGVTINNHRALLNARAALRRAGLPI